MSEMTPPPAEMPAAAPPAAPPAEAPRPAAPPVGSELPRPFGVPGAVQEGPRPPGAPPGPDGHRPPGPGGRPQARRGPRGRYPPRRRVCQFCVDKVKLIDYKDVSRLRRYLSDRAKIEPRRKTGTCAHHQRGLALALKRARFMALLPYTSEHIRVSGIVLRS